MFWCDTFYTGMGAYSQCNPTYTYAVGAYNTWGWARPWRYRGWWR